MKIENRVSQESILLSHICLSKVGVVEVEVRVVSQSMWDAKALTEHINNTLGSCNYKWLNRKHHDPMRYNNGHLRTETTRAIIQQMILKRDKPQGMTLGIVHQNTSNSTIMKRKF